MRVPTSVTTSIEVPVLTNSKPGVRSFVRTSFYSSTSTSSSTSSSNQSTIFSNFFLPNSSKLIHDYSPQFHFVPLTIPVTFSKTKFDNLTEFGLFAYCQRIRNTTIKVTSFRISISNRENSRILEIIIIGSRSFSYTSEDTLTTNRFILHAVFHDIVATKAYRQDSAKSSLYDDPAWQHFPQQSSFPERSSYVLRVFHAFLSSPFFEKRSRLLRQILDYITTCIL